MRATFLLENVKRKHNLGDLSLDRRTIFKFTLKIGCECMDVIQGGRIGPSAELL
jgi:hypothetical protein